MSEEASSRAAGLGLADVVCLVTGAASGIGRAVARRLIQEGAKVAATDRNVAALEAGSDTLGGSDGSVLRLGLDVTREKDWDEALAKVAASLGPLEILVNAAGTCSVKGLLNEELAHWRATYATNVEGPMLGMRAAGRVMTEAGSGVIVNIASASGIRPAPGATAYASSKAALRMMTKVAALEFASQGVRVNSLSPGGVATPMWTSQPWWSQHVREAGSEQAAWEAMAAETPLGRFAEAEEIAEAVAWLVSPRCSFAVGEDLVLDGGYSIG